MLTPVSTSSVPAPNGHYSQAIRASDWLHLSMQLPLRPDGTLPATVHEQVRQVVANCLAVVEAAGGGPRNVVSVGFVTTDISNWSTIDRVWSEVMGAHRPARAITVAPALHLDASVGLQLVAFLGEEPATRARETPFSA